MEALFLVYKPKNIDLGDAQMAYGKNVFRSNALVNKSCRASLKGQPARARLPDLYSLTPRINLSTKNTIFSTFHFLLTILALCLLCIFAILKLIALELF